MTPPDSEADVSRILQRLRSNETSVALAAADEAVGIVLYGGSALAVNGDRPIARLLDLDMGAFPHPAWAYAIPLAVSRWLGVWQRVDSPSKEVLERSASERSAAVSIYGHLARFGLDHPSPEVRSARYRLFAVTSPAPWSDLSVIRSSIADEENRLARACAVASAALLLVRSPELEQADILWLREFARDNPLVLDRLAEVPFQYAGKDESANLEALERLTGRPEIGRNSESSWPSERL